MKEENEEKNKAESFILQFAHLSEGKLFTNKDLKNKWTKMGISSILVMPFLFYYQIKKNLIDY